MDVERDGSEGVLRVKDNGIGIAPEVLPHVFDLFTQAERSLDRSQGGLGIGLALTRKLVELHGGRITANSDGLGQGSEFRVYLPLYEDPEAAQADGSLGALSDGASGRRVLVVEDNRDSAELIAMMLRMSDHDVQVAYDGLSALELAQGHRPEVVLLDIGLPGRDGYEVAREIRRDPELGGIVLVALTGYGQEEDKRRAREAGFDHHLTKPVKPEELEEIIGTPPQPPNSGGSRSAR